MDPQGLTNEPGTAPQDLYIADARNNQVRRVDAVTGIITTVAGTGVAGFSGDNGPALNAQLSGPSDVALDRTGNLYIGDQKNSRVRRVDTRGIITTVAGNGTFGYSGDGGSALSAALSYPTGIDVDDSGNLYIADQFNYRIRKVTPQGTISTTAGNGTFNPLAAAGDGAQATTVQLGVPTDVEVAPDGSLYIPEYYTHRVRKVRSNGVIITIAGNGNYGSSGDGGLAVNALLNAPFRVALDTLGNLFIADYANNKVRRVDVTTGIITTVAGTGTAGIQGDGGPAALATLYGATGLTVDTGGNLYIAQSDSARVRVVGQGGGAPPPPTPTYTPTSLPSATPTRTPTNTRTPTPIPSATWTSTATASMNAALLGSVILQGRPAPPDPRCSVPLQVSLTPQGGGSAVPCTTTTDQSGTFTCSGFLPGAYTACVKHSHTLQNCQSVTLVDGLNIVNFGTLREGDANNDDCVLLVDFSILGSTFGKCTGNAGFDGRADFDGSGCVVLLDFSLLTTNFSQCGVTTPAALATARRAGRALAGAVTSGGRAALAVTAPATVRVGQRFTVALQVEAGQQPVDGAAAYVNFDPQVLQVEEVTAGSKLGVELRRQVDNAAGSVDYAAATLETFPAGTFGLATLHVRALRTGTTTLALNRTAPRQSDVTFGGASVFAPPQIAIVTIANRALPHGAGHRTRPAAPHATRRDPPGLPAHQ